MGFSQLVSHDLTFTIGNGFNNWVYATAIQSDGKIIAGGEFTAYNGTTAARLVRINPNGTIDNTFNPGVLNNNVFSIAVQPDGKILIAGSFSTVNGVARSRIARLEPNGAVDLSFNPGTGFNFFARVIKLQDDGKILVGGDFTSFNNVACNYITRLNANGTIDTDFVTGSGFNNPVHALAIQADGKILAGGAFSVYNSNPSNRIVRLFSGGGYDNSFDIGLGINSGASAGIVRAIAIQSDGNIMVGGAFASFNNVPRSRILRLMANGSLDTVFDPGTGFSGHGNEVNALALQTNGKIIAGGSFSSYHSNPRSRIVRININGAIDTSFDPGTGLNEYVYSITMQPDEKIILAGAFNSYDGTTRNHITRLNNCTQTNAVISPVSCDSYTINGQTFNSSGTYIQTLANAAGCDSTLTINLTLKLSSASALYFDECEKVSVNGTTYTSSGTYTQNLSNAEGCDSIITIHIAIREPSEKIIYAEACESYQLNGQDYTQSGTYTQTLQNVMGCDSVIILNLTIKEVDTNISVSDNTITASVSGATFQWIDCNRETNPVLPGETGKSFTATENGSYAVIVFQNGCSDTSECVLISNVGLAGHNSFTGAFNLFPNPTRAEFIIYKENISGGSVQLIVRNLLGETVVLESYETGASLRKEISLAGVPSGVYFVQVEDTGGVSIKRLVVN